MILLSLFLYYITDVVSVILHSPLLRGTLCNTVVIQFYHFSPLTFHLSLNQHHSPRLRKIIGSDAVEIDTAGKTTGIKMNFMRSGG